MKKLLAVVLSTVFCLGLSGGANAAGGKCEGVEFKRSGEIRGTGRSVGFILGVRWGVGMVKMDDGREFKFRTKGIKAAEMGAAETKFVGQVFNLDNPEDFPGFYGGLSGGLTVIKGFGGASYQNDECVTLQIKRFDAQGVQTSLPFPSGIQFELTE
jgi:hypothetical protein